VSKPTELGTIFGMTALFGALPLLLTFLVYNFQPSAPSWLLGCLYLAFVGFGAWVFAEVFGD
jgi:hypothetical protein